MSYIYFITYHRLDPNPYTTAVLSLKDLIAVVVIFYTLSYIILPHFLFKGKLAITALFAYLSYIWWLLLTYFAGLYISHHFIVSVRLSKYLQMILQGGIPKLFGLSDISIFLLDFLFLIMPPLAIKLIKAIVIQSNRSIILERDKLDLEISFLKAQINPHFLFNTLNNIYSMIVTNDERAAPMVLHLSDLMRYTLYESDDTIISLAREISFIEDYLELERVRYGDKVSISLIVEGTIEDQQLAPLIMFPFIENAFKHGVDASIDESWVNILVKIDGQNLHFECINSTGAAIKEHRFGGVGLNNVKKRLEIYYKGNYNLSITNIENVYSVILDISI